MIERAVEIEPRRKMRHVERRQIGAAGSRERRPLAAKHGRESDSAEIDRRAIERRHAEPFELRPGAAGRPCLARRSGRELDLDDVASVRGRGHVRAWNANRKLERTARRARRDGEHQENREDEKGRAHERRRNDRPPGRRKVRS